MAVKCFATNNLVADHDMYVDFLKRRFSSLQEDGKKSADILFYKNGIIRELNDYPGSSCGKYASVCKWHCITLSYNIWTELVKDYVVPEKSAVVYKKFVAVPNDILKKFKYRVEQSIKNANCDFNKRIHRNDKHPLDGCRYLAMFWTYLSLKKDCTTQRYFPTLETIERAAKIFGYEKDENPFTMNGKFFPQVAKKEKTKMGTIDMDKLVAACDDKTKAKVGDIRSMEIEDLDFTVRTYNILKRACYNRLGDILDKNFHDITKIKNLGRHSLNEIIDKLKEYGYEYTPEGDIRPIPYPANVVGDNSLLSDLGFDSSYYLCLNRAGIHTVADFKSKSDKELLKVRSFGMTKLKKMREAIKKLTSTESVIDIAEQAAAEVATDNLLYGQSLDDLSEDYKHLLGVEKEYEALKARMEAMKEDYHNLKLYCDNLNSIIDRLKADYTKLEGECNTLKAVKGICDEMDKNVFTLIEMAIDIMNEKHMPVLQFAMGDMLIDIHTKAYEKEVRESYEKLWDRRPSYTVRSYSDYAVEKGKRGE